MIYVIDKHYKLSTHEFNFVYHCRSTFDRLGAWSFCLLLNRVDTRVTGNRHYIDHIRTDKKTHSNIV
jgi:hypothetical protein